MSSNWRDWEVIAVSPGAPEDWRDWEAAPEEETDEEKETRLLLEYARRRIAGSPIPNVLGGAVGMTAGVAGLAQRAAGGLLGDPESTARIAGAFEQAAEEEAGRPEKILPKRVARGVRSVVSTMPTQVFAGLVGGAPAMIGLAASQEANQAITKGREAGLEGAELAAFVSGQAAIEAVPAALMSKFGLGGLEAIFGKAATQSVAMGIAAGLKKAGILTVQELGEEILTEVSHNIADVVAGVDPKAANWDRIGDTVADTTIATLMQMGLASAPGVARAAIGTGKQKGLSPEGQPESVVLEPAGEQVDVDTVTPDVDTVRGGAAEAQAGGRGEGFTLRDPTQEEQEQAAAAESQTREAILDEETISLTKAEGAQIREDLGLRELPKPVAEGWGVAVDEVARTGADKNAMEMARNVLSEGRMIDRVEHVSAVIATGKILDQRKALKAEKAEASQSGNIAAFAEAARKLNESAESIAVLTAAVDTAGTELSRNFGIRQLTLARESHDLASVLTEIQSVQKPGVRTSEKQVQRAADWVDSYDKALKEMAETEDVVQAENEAKEAKVAQKVIDANKPRKRRGKTIREKAVAEREEIKARLRAMGQQVHDVSQVSVEGTYLIGRLGLTYVKEGAGTLVEVLERLQADMPELSLTQGEVNRALIQRSPKAKARKRSEAQKRERGLLSLAKEFVKIDDLSQDISFIATTGKIVPPELAKLRTMRRALEERQQLEKRLSRAEKGELPARKKRKTDSPVIAAMKKEISRLESVERLARKVELAEEGVFMAPAARQELEGLAAQLKKRYTKLRTAFFYADIEAAKKERAIARINKLQDDIKNGITNQKRNPRVVSPELASLHRKARAIITESRIDNEIAAIREQKRTGIFPEPKVKKREPVDPRLQAKRIVLRKLRKEKEKMIADAAPWTAGRVADEVVAAMKASKGTLDVSFTGRQNIAQVLPHPFVTTGKFLKSLKTLFNEEAADRIQDGIEKSINFDNYMRAELTILDANSPDAQQRNEGFMGTLIERVPLYGRLVKASSRQAVAIGNLVRTQAFDRYLYNNPEATLAEMKAFADIANKTTGIGDVKLLGKSLRYWTWGFWTPKFVASRLQTPLLLYKHWKLPRARNEIAKEMVRAAGTAGTILGLMGWAGAQVEWFDVDDPDWMKIRIGNQRFDIFGGIQQVIRVVFRIGAIGKRRVMNESQETSLYNQDPMELLSQAATFKASPTASMIAELLSGKTAVGEERTIPETLIRGLIPMVFEDIEDAWKIEGVERGVLTAPIVAVGIGGQTYYDSESRVRAKMKKLMRAGDYLEANRLKVQHNLRDPENKIVRVKVD